MLTDSAKRNIHNLINNKMTSVVEKIILSFYSAKEKHCNTRYHNAQFFLTSKTSKNIYERFSNSQRKRLEINGNKHDLNVYK